MISPAVLKAISRLRECLQENGADIQLIAVRADGAALCSILGDDCDDQLIFIDPINLYDPDAAVH